MENGIKLNHRSFFVIVGDRGKDQVIKLHYMLSKASIRPLPSVLWCYKSELGFTTHKMKRMKVIKRKKKQGLIDPEKNDPFELFLTATQIRWTYYKDTHKILGNTYGMCVLQDFEAITPNILARTIETVEGGGVIVLLLKTMGSLKQLYTMALDIHNRFRTGSHQEIVPRFNERFLLSLISCQQSIIVDDELNILPVSIASRQIVAVPARQSGEETSDEKELRELKEALADTEFVGALVARTKTLDQLRCLRLQGAYGL
jgi:N-acetyltransferase 10